MKKPWYDGIHEFLALMFFWFCWWFGFFMLNVAIRIPVTLWCLTMGLSLRQIEALLMDMVLHTRAFFEENQKARPK